MRVALYYAPAPGDPLWQAGCAWLGRDPETGAAPAQPDVPGIAAATGDPRLYGFHATLKPPMRLATDWHTFRDDAEALATSIAPFALPRLAVAELSGFLALRETAPCPPLQTLCDAAIAGVDRHRAPPTPEELARRRARGLSPEREAMLQRWGYPSAFATWRFHMTLTCRLPPEGHAVFAPAARAFFADSQAVKRRVEELCIFTQAAPGQPFMVAERLPLRG